MRPRARPTFVTPILRLTDRANGYYEYLGPFVSRGAALDAARAIHRIATYGVTDLHYQLDTGGASGSPGYYEEIPWEERGGEWWPVELGHDHRLIDRG